MQKNDGHIECHLNQIVPETISISFTKYSSLKAGGNAVHKTGDNRGEGLVLVKRCSRTW